jgi:MFS transporter, DHA1 family, inner membrane transport protein
MPLVFALYGVFAFIGIAIATRIVDAWGPYKTSVLFTVLMLTGVTGWALSAAPALASASVSLNTSVLYIGPAVGSAIGGVLYARDLWYGAGYVSMSFVALALAMVILTKPRRTMAPTGRKVKIAH